MLRVAAQRLAKRAAPQWGAAARPALVPFARAYADDANLLKTALYDFHLEMGARWCDEGGRSEETTTPDDMRSASLVPDLRSRPHCADRFFLDPARRFSRIAPRA